MNRTYYEQAWRAPHALTPDQLAQSGKSATFDTFADKKVLTDGSRSIEIYPIAGSGHNDAFARPCLRPLRCGPFPTCSTA